MNKENVINDLRFEILKPHHNVSGFRSCSDESDRYLKQDALKDQDEDDRVTHLVLYGEDVIGYFSLHVHFDGIPQQDYDEIKKNLPNLPEKGNLPLVEIEKFAMAQDYEDTDIAGCIFDNIVQNIRIIFEEYGFGGVSICLSDDCEIPMEE